MNAYEAIAAFLVNTLDIDRESLHPTMTLDELALDSFGRAELFLAVESAVGHDLDEHLFGSIVTLADLAGWLDQWSGS